MWKLIVLVAAVATTYGSKYADKMAVSVNEAVNGRYSSCGNFETGTYSEECTEVMEGYDYKTLTTQYEESVSALIGTCAYQWKRTHGLEKQLTSIKSLTGILSLLRLKTVDEDIRTQLSNIVNINSDEELRFLVPKTAPKVTYRIGDFVSEIKTAVFTSLDSPFSENFKSCLKEMLGGQTQMIDSKLPEKAADTMNSWFSAQSGRNEVIVSADDFNGNTGLIFGTYHYAEIQFKNFYFDNQVVIDFKVSKHETNKHSVWVGKGFAKTTYHKKLGARIIQFDLKGGLFAMIINPELGGMERVLYDLRDTTDLPDLISDVETKNIEVTMPIFTDNYGSEDFVPGLQLAQMLKPIYDSEFDGFGGILTNKSGHVSNMFHAMHMVVKGLGDSESFEERCVQRPEEIVVVKSPFAYYIYEPSGAMHFIGTYYGIA